jgi:putative flippase GtrA
MPRRAPFRYALTHRHSKRPSWLSAYSKAGATVHFVLAGAGELLVNQLLLRTHVERLHLHFLRAPLAATQGPTIWNFTFNEPWVYPGRGAGPRPVGFLHRYFPRRGVLYGRPGLINGVLMSFYDVMTGTKPYEIEQVEGS